jgi:protein-tyrosine phosphatase
MRTRILSHFIAYRFDIECAPISHDYPRMPSSHKKFRVLFVCLGNICRSPAAEIIFRQKAHDSGRADDFEIDSAGTIGLHQGSPPDPRMSEALTRKGYSISGKARKLLVSDLRDFDLIVTMDETNLSDARSLDSTGTLHAKIRPFVSFCSHHDDPRVPDPYYGGQRGFDHVIDLLQDGCEGILAETKS